MIDKAKVWERSYKWEKTGEMILDRKSVRKRRQNNKKRKDRVLEKRRKAKNKSDKKR